ncbi:MAG: tetratricopeptide repeat protein [Gammaproteobacteria bacterium]|nr:tetratricopeptide repeat protein [Gammaproteobacteria bacterium]
MSARLDRLAALVGEHKGVVVHYAGDAVLAEFSTASDALSCAVAAQREFAAEAAAEPDAAVTFRIGVNLGEVIVDRGDIYGDGVNVAARLEGLADPGGICVSESVRTAVGNKLPLDFEFMGEQQVKNIAGGVRAWRVHFYPAAPPARRSPARPVAIAVTVLLAAALAAAFYFGRRPDDTPAAAGGKPVIAVVPFANVSVEAADEYVADGLTDDVITDLSRVSGLDVIARGTVFTYKNRPINVVEIGRELGAHYVLEGSVRRAGESVRINVQLVDAVSGRHLWAERYERPWREFFAMQEEVIARIVDAVSVRLTDTEAERIARVPTTSPEAYDYYLRAEQAGYIGGAEGLGTTMALYARAVEIDPEFADAHAGLARAAVEAWREDLSQLIPGARARDRAYRSASRAIELDPANGRAWAVLAILQLAEGHHDAAIESARRAVALAPGSARAHLDLALVLAMSGQSADASAAVDTALRLDPRPSPDAMLYAGVVRFHDGRYQEAVDTLDAVRDSRASSSLTWMYPAAAHGLLGQLEQARAARQRFLEIFPAASLEYYRAAYAYIRDPGDLDELVRGLEAAGLPRWPYGVDPPASALLDEGALAELAIGRASTGRHLNGVEFVQRSTPRAGSPTAATPACRAERRPSATAGCASASTTPP